MMFDRAIGSLASRTRLLPAVLVAWMLAPAPAEAIEIQALESPGGIAYWLVEEPTIPIVAVEIGFRGGARLDPPDRLGLANMISGLLDEGAGQRDSLAFSRAQDDVSARFGFTASRDDFGVSARMLKENLAPSVALLADALAEPRFDAEPVARVRSQILSQLSQETTEPDAIAAKRWFARAFPDHPYGNPVEGTPETVAAIDVDDLRAGHQRLLTRSNAVIGVVGAITPDEAGAMIDGLFERLSQGATPPPQPIDDVPPPGLDLVRIDKPQSVAIFGQQGIRRDDPDFIPAYVLNYVLGGGGFVSRLMEEVREQRGLAYSVYSYLTVLDEVSLWMGGVQSANDRMAESLEVIRSVWQRVAEEGVTEAELESAKKYLTGAYPMQFDTNAKIANQLVFLQEEKLGIDYPDRRNAMIEAVTLEDIRRVAKRLLDPEKLSTVVVGQPADL